MNNKSTHTFWYLSCPYTFPLGAHLLYAPHSRYTLATKAARWLMDHGKPVFSPITHEHDIKSSAKREDWETLNLTILESPHCKGVIVLTTPGWKESKRVAQEIDIAKTLGKTVLYLEYPDWLDALCYNRSEPKIKETPE